MGPLSGSLLCDVGCTSKSLILFNYCMKCTRMCDTTLYPAAQQHPCESKEAIILLCRIIIHTSSLV
jgi:hypothetical protein